MNSRERWTIYPLLFLALGASLRDKLLAVSDVKAVRCESLTLVSKEGRPLAQLGTGPGELGRLLFFNADGKVVLSQGIEGDRKSGGFFMEVDPGGKAGGLLLNTSDGRRQVQIWSQNGAGSVQAYGPQQAAAKMSATPRGGVFAAMRADENMEMTLGHGDQLSGIFALDKQNGQLLTVQFHPLAIVNRTPPQEPEKTPPKASAEETPSSPAQP